MKVLVVFGSKRGGTAEIATTIAETLRGEGLEVDCTHAAAASNIERYDAIVVGGALYANRWLHEARRFVIQHAAVLRRRPVWMFSSGPLDDSAARSELAAVPSVADLAERVGARGHATFGGRLVADAKGFPASAMAKRHSGDWRDIGRIRAWARAVARDLIARPSPADYVSPSRELLLSTLCFVTGAAAIAGGLALIAGPDGRFLRLHPSVLAHSPFSTFLIPGLLLGVVVGLSNLLAGVLVRRHREHSHDAAFWAGIVLWSWIVAEITVLRTVHWLQVVFLSVSIAIIGLAFHARRAASVRPASVARPRRA